MVHHIRQYLLFILILVPFSHLIPAPQKILFELEPSSVTSGRSVTREWQSQFSLSRDGSVSALDISAVEWHVNAAQHPLLRNIFSLSVSENESAEEWEDRLEAMSGIVWAEPAPVRYTCVIKSSGRVRRDAPPNDPYYPLQWSLRKINAAAAWDICQGDTNVVVAIVDVGVDINHRDLARQVWINRIEENGEEGVDDDGNGFIDDIDGWDFVDDDPDPRPANPEHNHGTHVAGIVSAATDNNYGIAGMAGKCRIMAIRCGIGTYITTGYEGVVYAAASGADIINLSWGNTDPSNVERLTVEYAAEQGALVVAAAGNNEYNNLTHYPGAYEGVLSIAATSDGDRLADFSKYGDWVDMSAPGDTLISTIPGGFGILSGTSMATPLVAGVAALLKSYKPDWNADQLSMQLINSSDPIDRLNPDFAGDIGRGRLNAFRALADARSGFELLSVVFDDSSQGNGDGIIDSYEDILVTVTITNLLTRTAHVSGRLFSNDQHIQISPVYYDFGELKPGDSASNSSEPFQVETRSISFYGLSIDCKLELTGPDMIDQSLPFILQARPSSADHDNGSVSLTVTNFGALGYWNYRSGEDVGNSFRYRKRNLPALFHGSLMVAAPPDRVSDCAFGNKERSNFDFISTGRGFLIAETEFDQQEGHAFYRDDRADDILNISVRQDSYSFVSAPDDDYIILSYTITADRYAIDSMYVGLFLDWDVFQAEGNLCVWDSAAQVGWMEYFKPAWAIYGAGVLDQKTSFHVALDNSLVLTGARAWSDSTKIVKMLTGFDEANSDEIDDWSQLIGAGPFFLNRYDSTTVTFALLAGDDREDLIDNIIAARNKWNAHVSSQPHDNIPADFKLIAAYPSPFNSRVNVLCSTDIRGTVTWSVFDPTGRLVKDGSKSVLQPGMFIIPINGINLPSGQYLVLLQQRNRCLPVSVTLVK